ncbi:hypothetical protein TSAR_014334 [Trichomalopsis sarcophagae]|uniref:Uncharacterized protein n=1 Tax=Trichomalopsis sarcophagae TaxID=543379 RepID=A0A232EUL0_9HYME|nr:hypothetical protein TSAR_014334 [Trichomalopsis sarcophagae]
MKEEPNGGRKSSKEKFKLQGTEFKVVKNYKYWGFWLAINNSYNFYLRKLKFKGLTKRAKIENLGRMMYLYDTIAKAAIMYGVEIWGTERGNWKNAK